MTTMLGTIAGDFIGSVYEFNNTKDYDFPLFSEGCSYTDDSVVTMAVAEWLLTDQSCGQDTLVQCMVDWGGPFPLSFGRIWRRVQSLALYAGTFVGLWYRRVLGGKASVWFFWKWLCNESWSGRVVF